ncbi:hypothetical protein D3OALGB2SA_5102 [Olavius algarvensis associated proteobacterium Delta 3]|nr:hypothetical protein D3OALGB2SA_5102 [Olavius algarvensis associated proteobacterium Delta 3]
MTSCRGSGVLFGLSVLLMMFLCWMGGRFGPIGDRPLIVPGLSGEIPAGIFVLLFGAAWAVGLLVFLLFPRHLSDARATVWIVGIALLARLLLIPHPPSDDVNRYLWEGRLVREGISPYHFPPNHVSLSELTEGDRYHPKLNHPDVSAAYPPFTILLFAAAGGVFYHPLAVKLLVLACDIGTLVLLFLMLRHRGLDLRWSLLYAVNPIILYSFAGQGHFDAIHNLFMLGAIVLYDRKSWVWMFVVAGLAIQSKYVAALAIPFLLRRENIYWSWITVFVAALPFGLFVHEGAAAVFTGLIHFGEAFAFNGPIHGMLRWGFGDLATATMIGKTLFLVCYGGGCLYFHPRLNPRFAGDPVSGCFFSMGLLILLSPTVHFWYLSWIVPFLVIRPTASWIVLCLTVSTYFTTLGVQRATGIWHLPAWAWAMEWLPFLLLCSLDVRSGLRQAVRPMGHLPAQSMSVIIPTLNEADGISDCIRSVFDDPAVSEVIVVDGASGDGTATVAGAAGAQVLEHALPPDRGGGRGGQILAGLKKATGDVVAVVHADTRVRPPSFSRMCRVLSRQPMIVGGALGGCFSGTDPRFNALEAANDLKSALLRIHFGDQVQFFRRVPVTTYRLFPAIPLMEDVELSLRLNRLGRQTYLFGTASISARRWEAAGFGRAALIVRLVVEYLVARCCGRLETTEMYRRYYAATKN